jgi:TatD DNase family protein
MIFDTHAHYDSEQFEEDREALLSGLPAQGVRNVINVGATLEGCRASVELAEKYPFIYAAVGVHPDEVGELNEETFAWLREATKHPKVVAVGEIGLDYHWNVEPQEVQQQWFIRQLKLAREQNLPVNIHSREAAQDTMQIMQEHARGLQGIIHCYSYSREMAEEYVKMGFHIGIGGVVTFKNSKKLKNVAASIPVERIVLETDCPYMAPVPYRGKRNNSAYIDKVAEEIASLRGMTKEEVLQITEENARRLFPKVTQSM